MVPMKAHGEAVTGLFLVRESAAEGTRMLSSSNLLISVTRHDFIHLWAFTFKADSVGLFTQLILVKIATVSVWS
jgi:hypothetical protein